MARYCVHLDELEVEVDVQGDETDAIRTAREVTGISEVRTQRAHLLPDLPDVVDGSVDAPPDPAAPGDGAPTGTPAPAAAPAAPAAPKRTRKKATT